MQGVRSARKLPPVRVAGRPGRARVSPAGSVDWRPSDPSAAAPGAAPWPSSRSGCSATRCCAPRRVPVDGLRQGAAAAGRGPHRHHARGARRRAGGAADRRRAAGVHLVRRRRARPPGQPGARPVRGGAGRPRGLPVDPGPRPSTARRALRVVATRLRHARRAGHASRATSCWPGRSSTRPTTSTACCSSTGSTAETRKRGDEGDPRGRVVRRRAARPSRSRPHPTTASASDAGRLRGHARSRRCPRSRRSPPAGTSWSAWSPGPTRRPAAGRRLVASPVAQRAEELGVPVLKPEPPARPGVPGRAGRAGAGLLPGRRLRRAAARSARSTSRRTAGSTCTSRCCPPGAAPRRCSTRCGPATRSPAPPRSGSSQELDAGPTFGVMTETVRPDRHRRRPAGAARRGRGRAAGPHPRRHRGRHPGGPRAARRGRQPGPEDRRRGRRGRLDRAGRRRRPPGPGVHPGAGRLDDVRRPHRDRGPPAARLEPGRADDPRPRLDRACSACCWSGSSPSTSSPSASPPRPGKIDQQHRRRSNRRTRSCAAATPQRSGSARVRHDAAALGLAMPDHRRDRATSRPARDDVAVAAAAPRRRRPGY